MKALTLQGLTEVSLGRYLRTHVLCLKMTAHALHLVLNILLYTQVSATGYSNIAEAPRLTSLIINHSACDSMCMHALAQLSSLVILQLEAEWAAIAVEHDEVRTHKIISPRRQRCSPPRSLGLLKHLYVLRFVNTIVPWQPFVLRPDDVDLPDLNAAEALAHMRLLRAVQTGCTVDEHRNKVEDDYDHALPLIWGEILKLGGSLNVTCLSRWSKSDKLSSDCYHAKSPLKANKPNTWLISQRQPCCCFERVHLVLSL